jgi:23S rRNA (adenine2503-C2)-methyltransferase
MSNLPSSLKIKLAEVSYIGTLAVINKQISGDGTMKVLLSLSDGHTIESALMKHSNDSGRERRTVCVSTQVGCAVGCSFCSTGQQGFVRNLTQGEITGQVLYFARYLTGHTDMRTDIHYRESRPVTNIVFMGMGEPLANYENMMRAVEVLNAPDGFGLGMRNITISTAGMVPQIMRLSNEKLQAGLAVSLHASDNTLRDKLVPLN